MIYSQRHELPEPEMYVLTPEQADALARVDLGPKAQAMADRFGAVAVEGNVGVVVTEHEDGTNAAERYVNLGDDLGTEILPDENGTYERFGLPALAQAVEAARSQSPVESREALRDERLAFLAEPIPSLDQRPRRHVASYDYLFMEDGPERNRALAEHAAAESREREDLRRYCTVTEASKQYSAERLAYAESRDPEIRDIIARHHTEGVRVDIIRTNADLRYDLAEYLSRKLESHMAQMPERIVMNGEKSPNHRGYLDKGRMKSREYAVLLALSMIDGSFQQPGKGDAIEYDQIGRAIVGQHRAAAEILLS